jgi:antitoxin MazE
MDLHVSKWGNSLALRIPAEIARQLKLREGSVLEAQVTLDGCIAIRPARWDRKAFADKMNQLRASMPPTKSVIKELREASRY